MLAESALFAVVVGACAGRMEAPVAIPLRSYAGTDLRTASVQVGAESRPFIFDTGAGFTVITPDELDEAGCTPFGRVVGFRADGQPVALKRCGPVRLSIGGFAATGEVASFNLDSLLGKGAPPVGGLLGLESFRGQAITLDLGHDCLMVETPASLRARIRSMHRVGVRLSSGPGGDVVPFIQVRARTGTLWMEVDSGNNGPVFLAPNAVAQLQLDPGSAAHFPTTLDVVGLGRVPVVAARRNLIYDGQLDPAFLRRIVLTIDFARETAWAEFAGKSASACGAADR